MTEAEHIFLQVNVNMMAAYRKVPDKLWYRSQRRYDVGQEANAHPRETA